MKTKTKFPSYLLSFVYSLYSLKDRHSWMDCWDCSVLSNQEYPRSSLVVSPLTLISRRWRDSKMKFFSSFISILFSFLNKNRKKRGKDQRKRSRTGLQKKRKVDRKQNCYRFQVCRFVINRYNIGELFKLRIRGREDVTATPPSSEEAFRLPSAKHTPHG
jgi:hypothetical protein